ncbi:MAG: hypothetical protein Q4F49_05690 [Pseudoxanthomonas suwonensis]|nr:hypothetical protein [Pseudoxanthomonas suwonensis]
MTLSKTLPLLACLCVAATGCNADTTAETGTTANAASAQAEAPVAAPAEAERMAAPADDAEVIASVDENLRNTIGLAGVMTAMVEACGLGNAAQSREALANVQREMAPQGLSAAQVAAVFNAAYAGAKAKAAQVDAAEKERDCQGLRQMADPETARKVERALGDAEEALKQMPH